MKKIVLGLTIMAFIVAGSVNVVAQEKAPKEKQKTEVKTAKKAKSCCSSKKACDTKKSCDTKEKKGKKKEGK